MSRKKPPLPSDAVIHRGHRVFALISTWRVPTSPGTPDCGCESFRRWDAQQDSSRVMEFGVRLCRRHGLREYQRRKESLG